MGRQYFGISDKALGGNVSSTIQLHTYVCAYILYMHVSVYTIYTARHSLNSQRSHQTALCKRNAGGRPQIKTFGSSSFRTDAPISEGVHQIS